MNQEVREEVERVAALADVAREKGLVALQVGDIIMQLGPKPVPLSLPTSDEEMDALGRKRQPSRPGDDDDPNLLYGANPDNFDR